MAKDVYGVIAASLRMLSSTLPDIPYKLTAARHLGGLLPDGVSPSSIEINTNDGRRLILDPRNEAHKGLVFTGVYDPVETSILKRLVHRGDSVLDVGANLGWYTTLFSKLVGLEGQVLSVEPVPICYKTLEGNIRINEICKNVVPLNIALANHQGEGTIHLFNDQPDTHSSLSALGYTEYETIKVQVDTVDNVVARNLKRLHVLKIDAEGAERDVLRGAARTLSDERPIVMLEIHFGTCLPAGYEPSLLIGYLRSFGYVFYRMVGKETIERFSQRTTTRFMENVICIHRLLESDVLEHSGLKVVRGC